MSENKKPKTLTIVLIKGPYVTEDADIAFKTAINAKRKGYEVNLFLYLDGVWNSHLTSDKSYNNPGDWLKRAIRKGVNVKMCDRCSKARDLKYTNTIEGIGIPGTYEFVNLLKESDKVLSFGG
jgi:tRNA 2-thiouridine synthesizing protein D